MTFWQLKGTTPDGKVGYAWRGKIVQAQSNATIFSSPSAARKAAVAACKRHQGWSFEPIPWKTREYIRTDEHVVGYWMEHHTRNGFCALCGNRGFLDTRGITTYAGHECGKLQFCICPNGQRARELGLNVGELSESQTNHSAA